MDPNDGQRPGSLTDAEPPDSAGTAALVQPWLYLTDQLMPLIGEGGFCRLFARALRLSAVHFEPPASFAVTRPASDLLMSLTRTLNEIGPARAGAANAVLLDTFTTLLGKLIGEALTKQLIDVAMQGRSGQKRGQKRK